jgi:prepilin-type processing-associated H-X9-DG protein
VQKVRAAAASLSCKNNLKQIGLAMHNYHTALQHFPAGSRALNLNRCYDNWAIAILPYIEQDALNNLYNPNLLNEDPANAAVRSTLMKMYVCPTDPDAYQAMHPYAGPGQSQLYMPSNYKASEGLSDGISYWDRYSDAQTLLNAGRRSWLGPLHVTPVAGATGLSLSTESISSISDGTSNTLLVGEYSTTTAESHRAFWAYSYWEWSMSAVSTTQTGGPAPYTLLSDYNACAAQEANPSRSACKRGWSSLHGGGINFLMCDGSVRLIARTIDMTILQKLATIAGGEVVGDF